MMRHPVRVVRWVYRRRFSPLRMAGAALRRGDLTRLRGILWAWSSWYRVHRQLRRTGFTGVRIPAAPSGGTAQLAAARRVLDAVDASCLERALVTQRWHASQGTPRALVIGVSMLASGFHAHAWLDGDPDGTDGAADWHELHRRQAPDDWLAAPADQEAR